MKTPNITEAIAARKGNEKWGTEIAPIIQKLKEEVEELELSEMSLDKMDLIDELADVQFIVTRLTILVGESQSSLLHSAMQKHKIRETEPNYKKSK